MKSLKEFLNSKILEEESPPKTDDEGFISASDLHDHLDIQRRGKVDMHDYAAHVMFHCNRPELLAPYLDGMNMVQHRHAMGEIINHEDIILKNLYGNKALVATDNPVMEGRQVHDAPKDPPAILIMRRKSIRMYPDGQRVALYYVDKLNKYVTVPYQDMQWSVANEQTIFEKLSIIVEQNENMVVEHIDETISEITPEIANNILELYKKINESNKQKLIDMLESSANHFKQIVDFTKKS